MPENIFDGMRDKAHDVVSNTMGYTASWLPSDSTDGDEPLTARVLFNKPTDKEKVDGYEYDPYRYMMEYRNDFFPGLKDRVDSNRNETVFISGIEYYVRSIAAKYDGNTLIAELYKYQGGMSQGFSHSFS
ncbi:MAG: hypothetical protein M9904_02305 [Chitinophagaceae bacterium]|nr:hypothetical protein [Chitinophagaceae bacterium]